MSTGYCSWDSCSEGYALEKGFPGLRVSEPETLSLQKSAKNRGKNPNSLRSDMRIFAPNADSRKLRVPMSPANANEGGNSFRSWFSLWLVKNLSSFFNIIYLMK